MSTERVTEETFLRIDQGLEWHWEQYFTDTTGGPGSGGPMDWAAEPDRWELEAVIRTIGGQLLATLTNGEGADGALTGRADGILEFDLPAAVTATLPINRLTDLVADPRMAMFWNRGAMRFGVELTDNTTGLSWSILRGLAQVYRSNSGGS